MKPKTMKRLLALPVEQQEKVMKQARERLRKPPPQGEEPAATPKPDAKGKPDGATKGTSH